MPVSALAEVPSASRKPPTRSICHSSIGPPRSQRFQISLRRWRLTGSMTPARTRHRYTADSDGAGVTFLRTNSRASRRAPQYRCARRNSSTRTSISAGI